MRLVTCHQGRLQITEPRPDRAEPVASIDALALEPGQVHELLAADGMPRCVAVWMSAASARAVVWCEATAAPFPPAMAKAGVSPGSVYWVRSKDRAALLWAATEAMRCRGVGATIAVPNRLTMVEARRLRLAAERGGGVGILLRRPGDTIHAARTRWLVRPAPGDALTQRWRLTLVHGHGRSPDQDLFVEVNRETHHVRATAVLADRSHAATPASAAG